jgi:hypothetical protein
MSQDIGEILETLRTQVRAQRLAQGNTELTPTEQELRRSLDDIELHRVISAHWPLKARNPIERLINLINKVVRRLLRWYINPIVEQQNAYNEAVARSLRLFAEAYRELAETQRQGTTQPVPPNTPVPPSQKPPWPAEPADTAQLQTLIEQRAASDPEPRFIELDLVAQEPQLHIRQSITAHWPLAGSTAIGKVVAVAQTAVRRYLRWLINPIVEQQNNANQATTHAIQQLILLDAERRAEIAALRAHQQQ